MLTNEGIVRQAMLSTIVCKHIGTKAYYYAAMTRARKVNLAMEKISNLHMEGF
jgi:hypothetical protein